MIGDIRKGIMVHPGRKGGITIYTGISSGTIMGKKNPFGDSGGKKLYHSEGGAHISLEISLKEKEISICH